MRRVSPGKVNRAASKVSQVDFRGRRAADKDFKVADFKVVREAAIFKASPAAGQAWAAVPVEWAADRGEWGLGGPGCRG